MHGLHLWRATVSAAPSALATTHLPAYTHLLQRHAAAASAAATPTFAATPQVTPTTAAAATPATVPNAARRHGGACGTGREAAAAGSLPPGSTEAASRSGPSLDGAARQSGAAQASTGGSGSGSSDGGGDSGGGGRQGGGWSWGWWRAGAQRATGAGGGGWRATAFGHDFGAAAAGGLATFASMAVVAAAEVPDPDPSLPEALSSAQRALDAAWSQVEEEIARLNARLPAHAPSLKGVAPSVNEVHGAVEVVVPIREGADPNALLRELRKGLASQGSSTSYSESVYGASRTVRMEIRQPGGGTLRVMMFVPPSGGSEQAQVVVSKRGTFSQEELASLQRLVRAANLSFGMDQPARSPSAKRHGLHGGLDSEAHARAMDELFESFARSALSGLIAGPMQQILEELQRGVAGAQGEEEHEESGEHRGGPGGGFGGSFGPFGGGGGGGFGGLGGEGVGGGPFPGLPAPPPLAQYPRPKGRDHGGAQGHDWGSPAAARAVEQLTAMGAQVFPPGKKDKMDWGVLAGYADQKRTLEDCLLLPLLRPDVYAKLARATRKTFANNRPRAVLFEGPPGTGKTTSARVISSQAAVPLIYLPLEAVLSKWYGQSEQQLGAVFKAAEALGGAIIFLDELDALGANREAGGLHEVSRRLLSVLLREMEGFDAETKRTVVIGATNRKTDLDPALLSRFDLVITFGLPDAACRQLILRQYAQQLSEAELDQLAARTEGMSGRDLRDVCEHTERRWASKIIRGEVREGDLPPLSEYLASAAERANAVQRVQQQATAAGALNRLLTGGGGRSPSLPSWLTGGQQ